MSSAEGAYCTCMARLALASRSQGRVNDIGGTKAGGSGEQRGPRCEAGLVQVKARKGAAEATRFVLSVDEAVTSQQEQQKRPESNGHPLTTVPFSLTAHMSSANADS